jgi:hypothetical protein
MEHDIQTFIHDLNINSMNIFPIIQCDLSALSTSTITDLYVALTRYIYSMNLSYDLQQQINDFYVLVSQEYNKRLNSPVMLKETCIVIPNDTNETINDNTTLIDKHYDYDHCMTKCQPIIVILIFLFSFIIGIVIFAITMYLMM